MFEKRCEFCDKVFEGFSEKQVDNFLIQHIVSKHREFVEVKKNEVQSNADK